jgi:hypothetical protein
MKNTITLIAALLISIVSFAQTGFNYKAIIKDGSGNILANQDIDVKFKLEIFDIDGYWATVYHEIHNTTTNNNGIVILNIGEGNIVLAGVFPTTNWNSNYRLNTEIDIEKDGTFIALEPTKFKKVPMAIHANRSDLAIRAGNADYADVAANVTGLEKIDEGNGNGWRLVGRPSIYYGNIGGWAVDLSISNWSIEPFGATGWHSTALGSYTIAFGEYSTAIGSSTRATGNYSTAMGNSSSALGLNSTAMGLETIAVAESSTAIGKYNTADVNGLFMVGNGTSTSNRKNAFIIKEDGKIGINTSTPSSLFEVAHGSVAPTTTNWTNALSIKNIPNNNSWQFWTASTGLALYRKGAYRGGFDGISGAYTQVSDRRVKKDITPLDNGTLHKVLQLNPVSYLMKDQTDTNRNLGLISQEVQEIFPSLTHYVKDSDLLTLSYTELIPILIKALQEQQAIIETQNSKLTTQDSKIENLTAEIGQFKTLDLRIKQLENSLKTIAQ